MSTSAVFLRAASVGIPTAQPLKTGLRRSFTAIAQCRLLFQSKGKSSVTCADGSRQERSHTPRVLPSYNVFARPFHASAVCRANHDWGRPCNCNRCMEEAKEVSCQICGINPTVYHSCEECYDEETASFYYEFTSKRNEKKEKLRRKEAEAKIAAARQERFNKMLEHVKSLPPGEQVPMAYAVDKVSSIWSGTSAAQRHRALRERMSEELQIVKVRNRWKCDKGRVDAMDFDLWRSRYYTLP
ncbi:hypothetical protein QBC32DRAFT_401371 [Pseudoneurospora amorphoporcata]|uniref:Uncharacterized protein n=1 Tax=Pseudoneurospora amorphoporcata TaxID=241081 RepID=A0AAN6SBQ3_9PEZI|nr:hypothetical protein QBC32DRAFT_401371 [Pseudoneurospora amorphoporcata]